MPELFWPTAQMPSLLAITQMRNLFKFGQYELFIDYIFHVLHTDFVFKIPAARSAGSNLEVVRLQRTKIQLGGRGRCKPSNGSRAELWGAEGEAPKAPRISSFRNSKMVMLFEYLASWCEDR